MVEIEAIYRSCSKGGRLLHSVGSRVPRDRTGSERVVRGAQANPCKRTRQRMPLILKVRQTIKF